MHGFIERARRLKPLLAAVSVPASSLRGPAKPAAGRAACWSSPAQPRPRHGTPERSHGARGSRPCLLQMRASFPRLPTSFRQRRREQHIIRWDFGIGKTTRASANFSRFFLSSSMRRLQYSAPSPVVFWKVCGTHARPNPNTSRVQTCHGQLHRYWRAQLASSRRRRCAARS